MAVTSMATATTTLSRAKTIADRHIERRFGQPARVTDSGPEGDFGARWEIEVARADGVEFDVYVTARGKVVRVIRGVEDD